MVQLVLVLVLVPDSSPEMELACNRVQQQTLPRSENTSNRNTARLKADSLVQKTIY
jgi:hypothetical protein